MLPFLMVCSCLFSPACVANPQGGPVDAVFTRASSQDLYHDVDPVQVRAASFGRVEATVDPLVYTDRLVENLPPFAGTAVVPTVAPAVQVSYDLLIDADPLATRGWR